MGFRQADSEGRGGYARIWSIEDRGNYSTVKLSTSKKRRDNNGYETDFQDGFVRFVGTAHDKVKKLDIPENGTSIQITSCDVTVTYNAEKKRGYTNYVVFAFNLPGNNNSSGNSSPEVIKSSAKSSTKTGKGSEPEPEDVEEEDFPF